MRSKKDKSRRLEPTEKDSDPENTESVPQKEVQPTETNISPDDDNDGLDFGGLPDRDLKKNLGCG
jgi:hypothetical protein